MPRRLPQGQPGRIHTCRAHHAAHAAHSQPPPAHTRLLAKVSRRWTRAVVGLSGYGWRDHCAVLSRATRLAGRRTSTEARAAVWARSTQGATAAATRRQARGSARAPPPLTSQAALTFSCRCAPKTRAVAAATRGRRPCRNRSWARSRGKAAAPTRPARCRPPRHRGQRRCQRGSHRRRRRRRKCGFVRHDTALLVACLSLRMPENGLNAVANLGASIFDFIN